MLKKWTIICFAHNFRGYNEQFILKYMSEEKGWAPEIFLNGGPVYPVQQVEF